MDPQLLAEQPFQPLAFFGGSFLQRDCALLEHSRSEPTEPCLVVVGEDESPLILSRQLYEEPFPVCYEYCLHSSPLPSI